MGQNAYSDAMIRLIRGFFFFSRIFTSYLWLFAWIKLRGRRRMKAKIKASHERNADRLYAGMLRMQGVYIKMGQVLSVLGSFLPRAYIRRLETLQDAVPPKPFATIEKALKREYNGNYAAVFTTFSEVPEAAASLGQVHRARLANGDDVAVKVLYPKIDKIVRVDLRILRLALRAYRWFVPVINLQRIMDQVDDVLIRETNYLNEAKNLEALAANFETVDDVVFPRVYWEHTTARVLVLTYMEGVKIKNIGEMRANGIDPSVVARRLVETFYKQFLVDSLFHADPHPGNFLVQPGPRLVFLDFGAVEPVRPNLKSGMIRFLQGLVTKNDDVAFEGILEMGFVHPEGNRELLETTVRHYFNKLANLKIEDYGKIRVEEVIDRQDYQMVRDNLRELSASIEYPEGYFFIERSLVILFGLVAALDPKVNALELGFPYAMQMILGQLDAKRAQTVAAAAI